MKFRDSVKSTGSDIKLNSQDCVNNNFTEELKRPGAIVQGDPYIRDADDKWYNPRGCLDQLCLIFRCPCINKTNQIQPDAVHQRGGVQHSPISRNNFYPMPMNGVTRGMGNAPGQKSSSKVIQVNPTDRENDKYGFDNKSDDKTTTKKGENRAYGFDQPNGANSTKTKYGGNAYGFDQSDDRKDPDSYKNGNDRVYKIPVEDDSKDNMSIGAKVGISGRSLLSNPKVGDKAQDGMWTDPWSKPTQVKHAFSDPNKQDQQKLYRDGVNEDNRNSFESKDVNEAGSKHRSHRDHGISNWQSTDQNTKISDGYGAQKKSFESNNETFKNRSNDPDDPFGARSYPHGTPYPKKSNRAADFSTKNRSTENNNNQSLPHQKSLDSDKNHATKHGDGLSQFQSQSHQKFSEANKAKLFEPGAANQADRQYDAHKKNSVQNRNKGESNALNNGDRQYQTRRNFEPDKTVEFDEARGKHSEAFKGANETNRKKGNDKNVKITFGDKKGKEVGESNSKYKEKELYKGQGKNVKDDQFMTQNRQKTDRDGRNYSPVRRLSNERLPDDERKKVVREARQFRSDSTESVHLNEGLHQNTWTSTAVNYDSAEERDNYFSRNDESHLVVGRESLSADSVQRRARDLKNPSNFENGQAMKLTGKAPRAFKSDPNFNDELLDYRSSERIEPLGDAVQTGRAALSENQSGVNKLSNSTSVHGRMTHAASGHQNEFAPLSSRIVNLPEDEVDFATNSKAVKSPLKIVSNAKSYENLTQKNGYGDKIKYASLQHRKQPEVKSSKGSSLYPNTLQPFDSPKDALEKCLIQIESPEWEIVMQSLQGIVRLTRHHPEYLVSALHRVVTGLSKQIRSLRSQVTKAACVVSLELFEHLGKTMDPEVEEIAPALLSRTFDANKFLQHDANSALDSMIDNVSATRSATFLLSKGAKHRNAVVRTTACRLLARLCQNLGVEHVYSLPRDTRDSILNAAAKFLLEGSLETRAHAKELFSVLAKEPKFMRIMNDVVPSKTMEAVRKPLIKIINQK